MSVVLFCILSMNQDIEGRRCGYDCLSLSVAKSVFGSTRAEISYGNSDASLSFVSLFREVTYSRAASDSQPGYSPDQWSNVTLQSAETAYSYYAEYWYRLHSLRAEIMLPRSLQVPSAILTGSRAEYAYNTLETSVENSAINTSSVELEITHGAILKFPSAYSSRLLVEPSYALKDDSSLSLGVSDCELVFGKAAQSPGSVASKSWSELAYKNTSGKFFQEYVGIETTHARGVGSDDPSVQSLTASALGALAELSYNSEYDIAKTSIRSIRTGLEVSYSIWETNESPAVQVWQSPVGLDPKSISILGDGVFVACYGSSGVVELSLSDGQTRGCISTGTSPSSVVAYDQRVYIACPDSDLIAVYDAETYDTVALLAVQGGPSSLAVTLNGVVCTCSASSRLAVIDPETHAISYYACVRRPTSVTVEPTTRRIFIGSRDGIVQVLSPAFSEIARLTVGREVSQLSCSQYAYLSRVVVGSRSGKAVSMIDPVALTLDVHARVSLPVVGAVYSRSDIAIYTTAQNQFSILKSRSNDLSWRGIQTKIQGSTPRDLFVSGSRVYYTSPNNHTVGWV